MYNQDKTNNFISRASKKHSNKYSYDNVDYTNNKAKVIITCPIHGDFEQMAGSHLAGYGCKLCAHTSTGLKNRARKGTPNKTTAEFIADAINKHGSRYTYDRVVYTGNRGAVTITCAIHGDFTQAASDHLSGNGCQECGKISARNGIRSSTEEFVAKAIIVHGDKFSYDNTVYTGAKKKVYITCPIHGDFLQTANDHLNGCGCRHCRTENIGWTDSKWEKHGMKSKYFSGYKVYIAKIWDADEVFYKIGKTFVPVSSRFSGINMYYNYIILDTIEGDAKTICKLERKYQRMNKDNKYTPAVEFSGYTECFSKVVIGDKIYG